MVRSVWISVLTLLLSGLIGCNGNSSSKHDRVFFDSEVGNLRITGISEGSSGTTAYVDHPFRATVELEASEDTEFVSVILRTTGEAPLVFGGAMIQEVKAGIHEYPIEIIVEEEFLGRSGNYILHADLDGENSISETIETDNSTDGNSLAGLAVTITDQRADQQQLSITSASFASDTLIIGNDKPGETTSELHGTVSLLSNGAATEEASLRACVQIAGQCIPLLVSADDSNDYATSAPLRSIPEDSEESIAVNFEVDAASEQALFARSKETGSPAEIVITVTSTDASDFAAPGSFRFPIYVYPRTETIDKVEAIATGPESEFPDVDFQRALVSNFCKDDVCDDPNSLVTRSTEGLSQTIANLMASLSKYTEPVRIMKGGSKSYDWSNKYFGATPEFGAHVSVYMPDNGTAADFRGFGDMSTGITVKIVGHSIDLVSISGNVEVAPSSLENNSADVKLVILGEVVKEVQGSAEPSIEKDVDFSFPASEGASEKISLGPIKIGVHADAGGTIGLKGDLSLSPSQLALGVGPYVQVGASAGADLDLGIADVGVEADLTLLEDDFTISSSLSPSLDLDNGTVSADTDLSLVNSITGPNGKVKIWGSLHLLITTIHKSATLASFSTFQRSDTIYDNEGSFGPISFVD
ncbi:MAG: hypothetical protein KDD60_01100 [Bdellovibrionales bacterium]|nr:hypothetical protein [Bdellovibrionales bacterium]